MAIRSVFTLGLFTAGWYLAARFSGTALFFPGPESVAAALWEALLDAGLFMHLIASLVRVSLGVLCAVVISVPLGLLLGRTPWLEAHIDPLIQFFRPISPLAWVPLAIFWFGTSDTAAVFVITMACTFPLVVQVSAAARAVDPGLIRLLRNCGAGPSALFLHLFVPACLPTLANGLRLTVGLAWLVVVGAEMVAVQSGLGYLIIDARNSLRIDLLIAVMVVIGALGVLLNAALLRLERWVFSMHS